jgi:predicted outer membrane repeat protein
LTLTGGKSTDRGGAILADDYSALRLTGATVAGNTVVGDAGTLGGGIYSLGELTVTGSSVSGNTAVDGAGGGIWGGRVILVDSTVADNHADALAGGIFGVRMSLSNSTVSGNSSGASGGGIVSSSYSTSSLTSCTVTGNSAGYSGGGIYGEVTVTDSTVTGNSAGGRGGGIDGHPQRYSAGVVMVANSTVSGNTSLGDGGGINGGSVTMINSTVSGNRAGPDESGSSDYSSGGGISAGTVTLTSSTVTGNYAASYYSGGDGGGGIRSSAITLADSIVAGNAERDGVGNDVAGAIAFSNGHNIFGSDVAGAIIGDLQGVAPSLLFASIDPATGGGRLNAAGTTPLRNSITNPALSGGDPLAALPTDQLGHARPQPAGSLPDIGAAERNQALSTTASANNDVLTGTDDANVISARAGADLVRGLAGNDILRGEGGSDVLDGGPGNDLLDGGEGINLARFGGSTAVVIDLVAGTAKRGGETDTLSSIRGAIGSSAGDTFTGDGGPNWFQGGGGRDVATGGAARDLYDFDRVQDSLPGSANRDVIGDLAPQSDRINLTGIDADTTMAGNQAFRFVATDPLTGPGQLGYRLSGDNTIVRASTDADAGAELEIQLTGLSGVGDFVFYL